LLLHWDNVEWRVVEAPSRPDGLHTRLLDIDGSGPDDIWAVGSANQAPDPPVERVTSILHWDGAARAVVPSPNLGDVTNDINELLDVASIGPDNVWAVGRFEGGEFFTDRRSLLLNWDETQWRLVEHPCGVGLRAISAASADDIWAVGSDRICRFDGSSWTLVPTAPPGSPDRTIDLRDVAAVSATDAWAVGRETRLCGTEGQTCPYGIIHHWDGSGWSRVTTPPPVDLLDNLDHVDSLHVIAPGAIWATSDIGMLYYDGASWVRVPTERTHRVELLDVSASGPDDVWAVGGTAQAGGVTQALIRHAPGGSTGTVIGTTSGGSVLVSWTGPASGSVGTNSLGEYEILELPVGTYEFIVTSELCPPRFRTVVVTAGENIREDFPPC
jgi:hypothetical protein